MHSLLESKGAVGKVSLAWIEKLTHVDLRQYGQNTGGVLFFGEDSSESRDAIRQAEQSLLAAEMLLGEDVVKLRNR